MPTRPSSCFCRMTVESALTFTTSDWAPPWPHTIRCILSSRSSYKIDVSAGGFKTISRDNVTVEAAQATTTDFALEVGAQTEVVNVNADSTVILQKQDGARASTLESRQIVDLPVAALNPVNLVF